MVAPGAEEFVASETPGPWLPPERTFAPLGGPGTANAFSVERARYIDLLIEHDVRRRTTRVGVRRFYQNVDDQLVTLFGLNVPGGPQSVGHYYVANAGSLGADGWALRLSSTGKRVQRLDRLQRHARALARPRRHGRHRRVGAGRHSLRDRRSARRHDVGRHRHSRNGHARVRVLQDQHGLHALRHVAAACRVSTRGSTSRSIRRCPSSSAARDGKCCSAFAISSGIRTIPRRSTTSCSSSGHPSAWSAGSSFASERPFRGARSGRLAARPSTDCCKRLPGGSVHGPAFFCRFFRRPGFWIGCPDCWKPRRHSALKLLLDNDLSPISRAFDRERPLLRSKRTPLCRCSSLRSPVNKAALVRVVAQLAVVIGLVVLAALNISVKGWTEMEDGVLWVGNGSDVVASVVADDSPASRAGIKPGDVLLRIDQKPVQHPADVVESLHASTAGSRLEYVVLRQERIRAAGRSGRGDSFRHALAVSGARRASGCSRCSSARACGSAGRRTRRRCTSSGCASRSSAC